MTHKTQTMHPRCLAHLYQQLLTPNSLLTPRLEQYLRRPLYVHVLDCKVKNHYLTRHVLLRTSQQHVVEQAHITIDLNRLPKTIVEQILEANIPLGKILTNHNCPTTLKVQSLLRIPGSHKQAALFQLKRGRSCTLYAREVALLDQHQRKFAQSTDILAPIYRLQQIRACSKTRQLDDEERNLII